MIVFEVLKKIKKIKKGTLIFYDSGWFRFVDKDLKSEGICWYEDIKDLLEKKKIKVIKFEKKEKKIWDDFCHQMYESWINQLME